MQVSFHTRSRSGLTTPFDLLQQFSASTTEEVLPPVTRFRPFSVPALVLVRLSDELITLTSTAEK